MGILVKVTMSFTNFIQMGLALPLNWPGTVEKPVSTLEFIENMPVECRRRLPSTSRRAP